MIDFRYHLVSIVAIFLALAIGIVLGTTALNGPLTTSLQRTVNAANADANNLRGQAATLQQRVNAAGAFAQEAAPQLVAHLLDGQSAVLIEAPGDSSQVQDGVTTMLKQAGVTITGQVQLQSTFFDASATTLSKMDVLSQGLKPAGLALSNGTPQQRAARVLASAIVTKQPLDAADSTSQAILAGFAAQGFLTVSGQPAAHATLAVVITPADPPSGQNADQENQALAAMAAAVSSASLATVMAGPASSAQQGGSIAALRASSSANQVSSVDDADMPVGQIVVAQALAAQLRTRTAGSYGSGPGADQVAPSPMPMPTASASVSPTPTKQAAARGQR